MPTHRLAEEFAAQHGSREAPTARVGEVTRYVLGDPPAAQLTLPVGQSPLVEAGAGGELGELSLLCPPALVGRAVLLESVWIDLDAGDVTMPALAWHQCPAEAGAALRLPFTGFKPHAKMAAQAINAYVPSAGRVDTASIALGAGAILRLAIGLADPRPPAEAIPVRFRLSAEGRTGARLLLLDRVVEPAGRRSDQWVEIAVELADALRVVGPEFRLLFETSPFGPAGAAVFGVWGDPTIFEPPRAPPASRPNVILISVDTLRADRLGSYGADPLASPNLDRLASEGTFFELAVAQANWTLPSHVTMLTGTYPCVHGQGGGGPLHRGISPVAELLRRQGYATAAFTEDAYVSPDVFQRGFDSFRASTKGEWQQPGGDLEDTIASAKAWLTAHTQDEFLLFLHTYQVHAPYTPPPIYEEPVDLLASAANGSIADQEAIDYTQEVRYTDDVLGGFFTFVDALGLGSRTIVIVTSDHGEAFGEHGSRRHAMTGYDEELRVPLIWRAPGLLPEGHRVTNVVGLVDIVPTILDLLDLPVPEWVQGQSLVALMRPGDGVAPSTARVVFSEGLLGTFVARARMWKGIFRGPKVRVFLPTADPAEKRPQSKPALIEVARRARTLFDADCSRVRALVEHAGVPAPGALPFPADPERERKLRALGYVD